MVGIRRTMLRAGLNLVLIGAGLGLVACGGGSPQPTPAYHLEFGAAFDRLPSEVSSGFDTRLHVVLDPRLGASPTFSDAEALYQAMLLRGYGRLDDARLVEMLRLRAAALERADVASCAAFGRLDRDAFNTSDAGSRLDLTLDEEEYKRYFAIQVDAVEAEAAAEGPGGSLTPGGAGAVAETVMSAIFRRVFEGLEPADAQVAYPVLTGSDNTDASVCRAWRAIYRGVLELDPAALATYARGDIVPPLTPSR